MLPVLILLCFRWWLSVLVKQFKLYSFWLWTWFYRNGSAAIVVFCDSEFLWLYIFRDFDLCDPDSLWSLDLVTICFLRLSNSITSIILYSTYSTVIHLLFNLFNYRLFIKTIMRMINLHDFGTTVMARSLSLVIEFYFAWLFFIFYISILLTYVI